MDRIARCAADFAKWADCAALGFIRFAIDNLLLIFRLIFAPV